MNTMSICIHPSNLQSSASIVAWTERRVRTALRHFASRITRVKVYFADLNGPKEGKADLRCAIEVRINRRKPLVVEHRAADLYEAIDGAARKLRLAVGRAIDRVTSRGQRRARVTTGRAGVASDQSRPAPAGQWITAPSLAQDTVGASSHRQAAGNGPAMSHADKPAVIIAGFGPIGRTLADALDANNVPVTIIDSNARTVRIQMNLGRRTIHGDVTSPQTLTAAGIREAAALAITIPDAAVATKACAVARSLAPSVFIAMRTRHLSDALRARQVGADSVTVEEMVTARAMADSVTDILESCVFQTYERAD